MTIRVVILTKNHDSFFYNKTWGVNWNMEYEGMRCVRYGVQMVYRYVCVKSVSG